MRKVTIWRVVRVGRKLVRYSRGGFDDAEVRDLSGELGSLLVDIGDEMPGPLGRVIHTAGNVVVRSIDGFTREETEQTVSDLFDLAESLEGSGDAA